jgi:hypothetical protein
MTHPQPVPRPPEEEARDARAEYWDYKFETRMENLHGSSWAQALADAGDTLEACWWKIGAVSGTPNMDHALALAALVMERKRWEEAKLREDALIYSRQLEA